MNGYYAAYLLTKFSSDCNLVSISCCDPLIAILNYYILLVALKEFDLELMLSLKSC